MNILRNIILTTLLSSILTVDVEAQSPDIPAMAMTSAFSVSVTSSVEAYDISSVEITPAFPGGERELVSFINRERCYPRRAYSQGVEGRVVCGFIVNPDGAISHVSVVRGVNDELNREAVRVISSMPRWEPGVRDGAKVPVYCCLTIPFRL